MQKEPLYQMIRRGVMEKEWHGAMEEDGSGEKDRAEDRVEGQAEEREEEREEDRAETEEKVTDPDLVRNNNIPGIITNTY